MPVFRCLIVLALCLLSPILFAATTVSLVSIDDDPFGGGVNRQFDADDGDVFQTIVGDSVSSVQVSVDDFTFRFLGKDAQAPFVGSNPNSTVNETRQDKFPFMQITGMGNCDDATGKFEVYELEISAGRELLEFAADFVAVCSDEGSEGTFLGALRFESDVPIMDADADGIWDVADVCPNDEDEDQADTDFDGIGDACDPIAGTTLINFVSEAGDFIGQGESILFVDEEVALTGRGFDGGVEFAAGGYRFEFSPPSGEEFVEGQYNFATRNAFAKGSAAGLSVGGNGRGCNTARGRFNLREFVVDDIGQIERVAIDFEHYCASNYDDERLYGNIRWRSEIENPTVYDADGDGVLDIDDLCPTSQGGTRASDTDGDLLGDACDPYPFDRNNDMACLAEYESVDEAALGFEGEVATIMASVTAAQSEIVALTTTRDGLEAQIDAVEDSDGDSVSDLLDVCDDTGTGLDVDGRGCSQAQACALIAVESIADFKACHRVVFVNTVRACRAARQAEGFQCVAQ